jgi:DNA-binding MarR family transcriptional regulator
MKIDDEIKQREWKSAHQKAQINILFTSNWLTDKTKKVLKPYGLTPQQFNVLRILKGKHPESCAAFDIKAVMIDKGPDVTRLIDRLITKGYVTRNVCEENRRKMDICITKEGLNLLHEIRPELKKQAKALEKITTKEAEELSRILDKMRE